MTFVNLYWGGVLAFHPFILRIIDRPAAREGKDFYFYFVVCLGVVLFGSGKLPKKETIAFSILMTAGFLNQYNFMSYFAAYQMIYTVISIVFLAHIYGKKINLLNAVAIGGLLGSLFVIAEKCGFPLYIEYVKAVFGSTVTIIKSPIITGHLDNPNLTGAHIALCLPAIFRKKWCYLAPIYLLAIYLTKSQMSSITALAAVLYFGYVKYFRCHGLPYIASLIAMIGVYKFAPRGQFGIDSGRFEAWDIMLNKAVVHFPFGNGLGWFADNFHKKYQVFKMSWLQEHNEFISAYFSFGVVGLVIGAYLISRAVKGNNKLALSGMFAFFVNCFGNFPLHVTTLAAIGIIYYALSLQSAEALSDKTV